MGTTNHFTIKHNNKPNNRWSYFINLSISLFILLRYGRWSWRYGNGNGPWRHGNGYGNGRNVRDGWNVRNGRDDGKQRRFILLPDSANAPIDVVCHTKPVPSGSNARA